MKPSIFFLLVFISSFTNCRAQEKTSNTLSFTESMVSPDANLSDVSWIQGHWIGEAFGGEVEEIWSPPLGDSMMFSFKLVVDDKVSFYELGGIRQVNNTLMFQLKHFNNDFKGWEEKNETVDAKLVKIEKNRIYFNNFTFEKVNENRMNIYVVISEKENEKQEVIFKYKRQ